LILGGQVAGARPARSNRQLVGAADPEHVRARHARRVRHQLLGDEDGARLEGVDDATLGFRGVHSFDDLRHQVDGARQWQQTFFCYQILEGANSLLVDQLGPQLRCRQ